MGSLCSCEDEGVLSSDDDPCSAEFQSMLANEISEKKIQEIEGKYGSAPPLPGTTANTNNKPNGNVLAAPPGFQFPRGPVPRIPIPGSIVSIPPGVAGGMMGGQGHLAGMQSMGGASMPMNPQMMGMGAMGKWMPNVNMPGAMGKGGMPMPMMQMKRSGMPNQHAASYEPPTSAGSPGSITSVSSAPTRTSRDIGLRQTYAPSLLQKSVQEVEEREISFKGSRGGMQELRKLQEEAQQWQQENLKISEEIQSRKEEADRQSAICKELHESQEEAERQKVAWQEDARKAREDADRISLRNAEDFRRVQLEAEQQLALATRQAEELDECVQTNQLLSAEAILLTEKSQILQELEEQESEADRLCDAEEELESFSVVAGWRGTRVLESERLPHYWNPDLREEFEVPDASDGPKGQSEEPSRTGTPEPGDPDEVVDGSNVEEEMLGISSDLTAVEEAVAHPRLALLHGWQARSFAKLCNLEKFLPKPIMVFRERAILFLQGWCGTVGVSIDSG